MSFLQLLVLGNEEGIFFVDQSNEGIEKYPFVIQVKNFFLDPRPEIQIIMNRNRLTLKAKPDLFTYITQMVKLAMSQVYLPECQHLGPRVSKLKKRLHTQLSLYPFSTYIHNEQDSLWPSQRAFLCKNQIYCKMPFNFIV